LEITEVSFIAFVWAFIAGLASFLSPCVLPLLPGYLSYVSGVGVNELGAQTRKVAIASIAFVGGFTTFFALQGAAAGFAGSELGNFLNFFTSTTGEGKRILEVFAGTLLTAFGAFILGESHRFRPSRKKYLSLAIFVAALVLVFGYFTATGDNIGTDAIVYFVSGLVITGAFAVGLFPLTALEKERRLRLLKQPASLVGVVLAGMVFSIGIGPCTGPLLGSVIMLAVGTQAPASGASLMFVYALGMGFPFVISGFLFAKMIGTFDTVKRHFEIIKVLSGLLLAAFGIVLITGEMEIITGWLQHWMPTIDI
jgi:cytochrome c-type biogenesis protein